MLDRRRSEKLFASVREQRNFFHGNDFERIRVEGEHGSRLGVRCVVLGIPVLFLRQRQNEVIACLFRINDLFEQDIRQKQLPAVPLAVKADEAAETAVVAEDIVTVPAAGV